MESQIGQVMILHILINLAQEEEKRKGFEAGADRYIVKSAFDKDTLLTAVESLIGSN